MLRAQKSLPSTMHPSSLNPPAIGTTSTCAEIQGPAAYLLYVHAAPTFYPLSFSYW